ncbi:unnamed protein product [Caenorhabditis angaria]|uniref:Uncharacterized protein n=1 Tax=Caenorhabditis angaria TaxID=860376 RepID=A0A9P1IXA0_9PELO|nr:unnamed protein product [Caenorhabditis angaria]
MLEIVLFVLFVFVIIINCSFRPSSSTRCDPRKSLDPQIDSDIKRKYIPNMPVWDETLPDVLEVYDSVQAKQRSEDCTESGIEI